MTPVLITIALLAACWALVLIVINRPVVLLRRDSQALVGVTALLEVGLLAQAVIGLVSIVGTDRAVDRLSFAGYLVAPLLILPLAVVWALAERTRWGPGVLVIGCLAVPVMIVRLQQIWAGHA